VHTGGLRANCFIGCFGKNDRPTDSLQKNALLFLEFFFREEASINETSKLIQLIGSRLNHKSRRSRPNSDPLFDYVSRSFKRFIVVEAHRVFVPRSGNTPPRLSIPPARVN
jgi:hypothetical protein